MSGESIEEAYKELTRRCAEHIRIGANLLQCVQQGPHTIHHADGVITGSGQVKTIRWLVEYYE